VPREQKRPPEGRSVSKSSSARLRASIDSQAEHRDGADCIDRQARRGRPTIDTCADDLHRSSRLQGLIAAAIGHEADACDLLKSHIKNPHLVAILLDAHFAYGNRRVGSNQGCRRIGHFRSLRSFRSLTAFATLKNELLRIMR